jgi:hypothetical protein
MSSLAMKSFHPCTGIVLEPFLPPVFLIPGAQNDASYSPCDEIALIDRGLNNGRLTRQNVQSGARSWSIAPSGSETGAVLIGWPEFQI